MVRRFRPVGWIEWVIFAGLVFIVLSVAAYGIGEATSTTVAEQPLPAHCCGTNQR